MVEKVDAKAGPITFQLKPEFRENPSLTFRAVLKSLNDTLKYDDSRLLIMWDEYPDAIAAIA
jgi:hypothetical protein